MEAKYPNKTLCQQLKVRTNPTLGRMVEYYISDSVAS